MIVVAVASGTSADGLDVGLVDLDLAPDGAVDLAVLDTWTDPWPHGLAERVLALLPPAATTAAELCALDTAIGQAAADAAARAVAACRDGGHPLPTFVVSPGQTVHHEVRGDACLGTLQLGQPAWVAEATGLPVVSDLRARDVAAGGHGAPLASTLDALWLGGDDITRAALNLGGIANVTVVGPGAPPLAWDTGPANCLLDVAAERASAGALHYDRGGAMARRGTVDAGLLDILLAHPYFRLEPPVSTGRETFSAALLDEAVAQAGTSAWDDVLATLVDLTAVTVARALAPHRPTEVVASGGGTDNPTLMAALRRHLAEGTRLLVSDERGIPSAGKEAVLWALLGFLTWHGLPAATPATGARASRLLGRISPGNQPLVLPAPATRAPTRLRVARREGA